MKQYDIFWTDIPAPEPGQETYITYGKRPAVIVSNDENNSHSNAVTILPITSNLSKKPMPTHVFIKGQGLTYPGIILAEEIITLDKSRILEKIGTITKEWDKLHIQHAMQVQLGMVET